MERSASDSRKKRKICQEEEEEEDEAKMETFFALVRNIRDTRERWMGLMSESDRKNNKRGKIIMTAKEEENKNRVWKPTFQLEDFADEEAVRGNSDPSLALLAGPSSSQNSKKEDAEKGIDLSLSL